MTLKEWRKKQKLNQEQLAQMLGVHQSKVSRLEDGHKPDLKLAVAIEDLTKGKIKARSWA